MAPSSVFKARNVSLSILSDLCFQPYILSNFNPFASLIKESFKLHWAIQIIQDHLSLQNP